jgi:AraC-like DNA-binding protein
VDELASLPQRNTADNAHLGSRVRCLLFQGKEVEHDYDATFDRLTFYLQVSGHVALRDPQRGEVLLPDEFGASVGTPGLRWCGSWHGQYEAMVAVIDDGLVAECLGLHTSLPHLDYPLFTSDPQVLRLLQALKHDITAGSPVGPLFSEHVGGALVTYAAKTLFGAPERHRASGTALSPRQVETVRDHVEAHLGEDIRMPELAALLDLSPSHFRLQFGRAMGMPPHRYVLGRRIERAKAALRDGGVALSDLALQLGFCDQSQFTRSFRSVVGTTPKRYQRGQKGR